MNNNPEITIPINAETNQETPLTFSTADGLGLQVSDADNDLLEVIITVRDARGILIVAAGDGTALVNGDSTDTLIIRGNADEINALLEGLVYMPNDGVYGDEEITFSVQDIKIMPAADGGGDIEVKGTPVIETVTVAVNGQPEIAYADIVPVTEDQRGVKVAEVFVIENDASQTISLLTNDPEGDPLTFAIVRGNRDNLFTIDSNTGEISLTAALDVYDDYRHQLKVKVTDTKGASSTVWVNVNVTQKLFVVAEDIANGREVGRIGRADEDDGNTLVYSITAGRGGLFAINAETGIITLAAGRTLDYEYTASHTFTVTARDSVTGEVRDNTIVTVQVTDVDETPIVSGDLAIALGREWEYQLTTNDLSAADTTIGGGDTEIIWQVTETDGGYLALGSDTSTQIDSFTQTQLEAGNVFYVNLYNQAHVFGGTDSFTVQAGYDSDIPQSADAVTVEVEIVQDASARSNPLDAATSVTNPWLSALLFKDGGWQTAFDDPSIIIIDYAFKSGSLSNSFNQPSDLSSEVGKVWADYEENALRAAMDMWSAVTNVVFIEVDPFYFPALAYWLVPDVSDGAYGAHQLPAIPAGVAGLAVNGYFDYDKKGWDEEGLEVGGHSFRTMLHELGHGLGLIHPHEDGTFPGVSDEDSGDLGDFDLNQGIYTVMSYNRGWDEEDIPSSYNYGRAGTPMAFDVAAIQELYGANMEFRTGDDIYILPDTNGIGTYWHCIWDAGGEDTIMAAEGTLGCTIDLRAADLEGEGGGGYVSYHNDIVGGFTIANKVLIENAIGSWGDDKIIGNVADNSITGDIGDDTLTGGGGRDTFIFGSVTVENFVTTVRNNFGSDTITDFDVARDIIRFDSFEEAATRAEFIAALRSDGDDVVYDFGNDGVHVLRLSGVTIADLETTARAIGNEFRVNSETERGQKAPSTAALSDGGFVVAWQSREQDGDYFDIYAQRYDHAGNTVGNEFLVNSEVGRGQESPSVTGLSDGGFVVAWQSQGQDGSGYGIYAQRYDSAGHVVGNEFLVNSETKRGQKEPSIAGLSDGGFVITWGSFKQDGDDGGVYAQRYDHAGNSVGGEFRVNSVTDYWQGGAVVAGLSGGGFVIAWESFKQDEDGNGVYLQYYDSDGNPGGEEFRAYPSGQQWYPSVAALSGGGFVLVWQSLQSEENDEVCAFAQRYDSTGNPIGDRIQVNDCASGNQMHLSVTAVRDDGFVVTWQSWEQDGSDRGISAQRFDGDGNPVGGDFLVNSYTTDRQEKPSIAGLSDGRFVITWESNKQDGSGDGVYAQIYRGIEFQVNSETAKWQDNPAIAGLNDSGFVVTWQSRDQDGDGYGVYAQRYDGVGNPVGDEFRANSETAKWQGRSSVAGLNDGGFIITWESQGQDGSNYGIYAQRYDDAGNTVGDEFRVNSHIAGRQWWSSVTGLDEGGFVIVWTSAGQDGDGNGIYAQRYDDAGNTVGDEFRVNSYTAGDQDSPSVAALGDGGFVVVWESWNQDGSGNGIYAQRYDNNGWTLGGEFEVNSTTDNWQHKPVVTALQDGGFVIVWQSHQQDGSGNDIYGQRYDSASNAVGDEFLINSYTVGNQRDISITALNDGGFLVAWESDGQDGSGYGVYAQRYDSAGDAVGDEFQVSSHTARDQDSPSVAGLNNGGFVMAWESKRQDGDGEGVFAQVYNADEMPDDWFINAAFDAGEQALLFG